MADAADIAGTDNELFLNRAIEAARSTVTSTPGPSRCIKCGAVNDRADAGYAVCSDCVAFAAKVAANVARIRVDD